MYEEKSDSKFLFHKISIPSEVGTHSVLALSNSNSLAAITPWGSNGLPSASNWPAVRVILSKKIYPWLAVVICIAILTLFPAYWDKSYVFWDQPLTVSWTESSVTVKSASEVDPVGESITS